MRRQAVELFRRAALAPEQTAYTPAAGQNPGVLTAKVNDDAPYGTYAVRAVLNGRAFPITAKLVIGPPAAARSPLRNSTRRKPTTPSRSGFPPKNKAATPRG